MIFNVSFKESSQVIGDGAAVESGALTAAAISEHNKDSAAHPGLLNGYAKIEEVTEAVEAQLKEDLQELDNKTAELAANIGDIETALDNIVAIQNNLIGGEG